MCRTPRQSRSSPPLNNPGQDAVDSLFDPPHLIWEVVVGHSNVAPVAQSRIWS